MTDKPTQIEDSLGCQKIGGFWAIINVCCWGRVWGWSKVVVLWPLLLLVDW